MSVTRNVIVAWACMLTLAVAAAVRGEDRNSDAASADAAKPVDVQQTSPPAVAPSTSGTSTTQQATPPQPTPGSSSIPPESASAPVAKPGAVEVQATITGVEGIVQVRMGEDQPWQRAKVAMVVGQGAEFRTMLRSAVRFVIPPGQTITLNTLGTMTLLQAVRQQEGRFKTTVGLEYGRVQYEIEASEGQHDSTIRSPGSTLAIRGTGVNYEDRADQFPVMVVVDHGTAAFDKKSGSTVLVGHRQRTARMTTNDDSPAGAARREGRVNPRTDYAGQTDTELALLETSPVLAGNLMRATGVSAFQQSARARATDQRMMVGGGGGIGGGGGMGGGGSMEGEPEVDLSTFGLAFVTIWHGLGDVGSNIDMSIQSPLDEPALSADHPQVNSGGRFFGDFRASGSTNFGGGEVAAWLTHNFPQGQYDVTLQLNDFATGMPSDSAEYDLSVFSNMAEAERGFSRVARYDGTLTRESPTRTITVNTNELSDYGGYEALSAEMPSRIQTPVISQH